MTQEEKNKLIEEVIDNFDFERVDKAMRALKWKWAINGCNKLIFPGVYGLITKARYLLNKVLDCKGKGIHFLSTGGFHVTWDGKMLQLDFVLETGVSFKNEGDGK